MSTYTTRCNFRAQPPIGNCLQFQRNSNYGEFAAINPIPKNTHIATSANHISLTTNGLSLPHPPHRPHRHLIHGFHHLLHLVELLQEGIYLRDILPSPGGQPFAARNIDHVRI
jgi:hypothetical protein